MIFFKIFNKHLTLHWLNAFRVRSTPNTAITTANVRLTSRTIVHRTAIEFDCEKTKNYSLQRNLIIIIFRFLLGSVIGGWGVGALVGQSDGFMLLWIITYKSKWYREGRKKNLKWFLLSVKALKYWISGENNNFNYTLPNKAGQNDFASSQIPSFYVLLKY